MNLVEMTLFHGSGAESVSPTFGLGNDHRLARDRMDELIAGPRNPAIKVMSTLV